jgi:hypothetical protein
MWRDDLFKHHYSKEMISQSELWMISMSREIAWRSRYLNVTAQISIALFHCRVW